LLVAAVTYSFLPATIRDNVDIPCLFTWFAGIKCPGCGVKTAISELLAGDWQEAMNTNQAAPLVLAAMVLAAGREIRSVIVRGKLRG
jgi:hypothetical protein